MFINCGYDNLKELKNTKKINVGKFCFLLILAGKSNWLFPGGVFIKNSDKLIMSLNTPETKKNWVSLKRKKKFMPKAILQPFLSEMLQHS